MDDLISRQAAIDALDTGLWGVEWDKALATAMLKDLPSAQPEVIRCKDCKYASPNGKYGCTAYHFKLYETHGMKADDYCSRAERRTDEVD